MPVASRERRCRYAHIFHFYMWMYLPGGGISYFDAYGHKDAGEHCAEDIPAGLHRHLSYILLAYE